LHRWRTKSRQAEVMRRRVRVPAPRSSFAGYRFPPEVILVAVRWYLRYGMRCAIESGGVLLPADERNAA
jgi:hypothetical protein